jgi:hypothetical protein
MHAIVFCFYELIFYFSIHQWSQGVAWIKGIKLSVALTLWEIPRINILIIK